MDTLIQTLAQNLNSQSFPRFGVRAAVGALVLFAGVSMTIDRGYAQSSTPATTTSSAAADASRVLVRVDGLNITAQDLDIAAQDLQDRLPANSKDPNRQEYLISYMTDLRLGAKVAVAESIAETEQFKRRLAYYREKLLLDEYLTREAKKAITPESLKKTYDDTTKDLKPEEEVRARHILVESEEEAKKAAARLTAGEDFAKIAKDVSKDPTVSQNGGDLGFFTRETMVKPFADAAFSLDAGKISNPVQSQFGWHVIKVEEKRIKPLPKFEEVKEQINAYLERKTQQDIILALRSKAKVERLEAPAPEAAKQDGAKKDQQK